MGQGRRKLPRNERLCDLLGPEKNERLIDGGSVRNEAPTVGSGAAGDTTRAWEERGGRGKQAEDSHLR